MKNNNYKLINYKPSSYIKINGKINKLGFTTIYVNSSNLGRVLDKIITRKKLFVHKINFKDSNALYIGHSGRNIESSIKEHKESILKKNK